jgi:hypothetical protein
MMSFVIDNPATIAPAVRERDTADHIDHADHADHEREPELSRIWVLLEGLAWAGALWDPSGALAAQRFARAREEYQRHGRR